MFSFVSLDFQYSRTLEKQRKDPFSCFWCLSISLVPRPYTRPRVSHWAVSGGLVFAACPHCWHYSTLVSSFSRWSPSVGKITLIGCLVTRISAWEREVRKERKWLKSRGYMQRLSFFIHHPHTWTFSGRHGVEKEDWSAWGEEGEQWSKQSFSWQQFVYLHPSDLQFPFLNDEYRNSAVVANSLVFLEKSLCIRVILPSRTNSWQISNHHDD